MTGRGAGGARHAARGRRASRDRMPGRRYLEPPHLPRSTARSLLFSVTVLMALVLWVSVSALRPPLRALAEDGSPTAGAIAAASLDPSAPASDPAPSTGPAPAETSPGPAAAPAQSQGTTSPDPTPAPSPEPSPTSATAPTIVSNQTDYEPGVPVILTGAGWRPDEDVLIEVRAADGYDWQLAETVRADAAGGFTFRFTLPDILIPSYDVTATGPLSGTATTSFTDSAGSYSLKWYASDPDVNKAPYLPTYTKISPPQALPYPVGRASNPMVHAVAYGPTASTLDAVTSLSPKSMALGQIVPFQMVITVTGSTAPENGVITFQSSWLARTTNGNDFGFDPATYGLIAAFVDAGDVGSVDPLANARVSSFSWSRVDAGTNNDRVVGTTTVTGLDPGDQVVVELWTVLKSTIASGVSGNVQTSLVAAATGPNLSGSAINTGNQTVPLLRANEFFTSSTDLSVTKSDSPDPVLRGQQLTYSLVATNTSLDTVANGVVLTDTLDPATTFVSGSWPTGTCTASGGVVTCAIGALTQQQSITVTIVVTVSPTAPYTNDTSTNPATGTCTVSGPGIDLCNRVSLSLIGSDPNTANNSASAPTNVVTGSVSLSKVSTSGAFLPGASFRLYTGTPASPFDPANPGTQFGAGTLYTTDATGRLTVGVLPHGSFYFVETAAPSGYLLNPTPVTFSITVGAHVRVEQVSAVNYIRPTISKWVTSSGRTADSTGYGSDLTWVLQPKVPENITSYSSYVVEDVLDPKLTYTGNLRVRIGSTTLTPGTHYTVTSPLTTSGGTLRVALIGSSLGSFSASDLVNNTVITFTTQVNTAAIMGQAIPNTATVAYNDRISAPATATSGTATAYTGGKVFRKVAETENGTPLPGAQFKVAYDSAGTSFVKDSTGNDLLLTSGGDGSFFVKGLAYDLANGTNYYLVEVRAPVVGGTPYNLLQAPVVFTVTGTSFYTDPTVVTSTSTAPTASQQRIINRTGFQIPATGGPGAALFPILGLVLMGGALAARKK